MKILFILQRDDHYRNYIESKAFEEVESKYECYIIAASSGNVGVIKGIKELEKRNNFMGFYNVNSAIKKKYKAILRL